MLPPREAAALSEEIAGIGESSGDLQVLGWGLAGLGRSYWKAGDLERAAAHLRRALEVLNTVLDYAFVASASGDLGICYLRQGRLSAALETVEAANRLIAERRLRGLLPTQAYLARAEARVVALDQASGDQRATASRRARRACRAALQQSALDRQGAPTAYRLRGTYEWLCGNPARARAWWTRSVSAAEALGLRYELGLAYLETGKRTEDVRLLRQADAVFTELGARFDVGVVSRLIGESTLASSRPDGPVAAASHFERSIATLQSIGAENELAVAHAGYGRLHKRQGRFVEARHCLTLALEIFERLGTRVEADKIRQELHELP